MRTIDNVGEDKKRLGHTVLTCKGIQKGRCKSHEIAAWHPRFSVPFQKTTRVDTAAMTGIAKKIL